MSIRDEIREILAEGRVRTTAQLAEALGKPPKVIAQQLGGMHDVTFEEDSHGRTWSLIPGAGEAPKRTRRARAEPEPTEPADFDCAVWMDGSVVIVGAGVRGDGTVLLQADDARKLAALLAKVNA